LYEDEKPWYIEIDEEHYIEKLVDKLHVQIKTFVKDKDKQIYTEFEKQVRFFAPELKLKTHQSKIEVLKYTIEVELENTLKKNNLTECELRYESLNIPQTIIKNLPDVEPGKYFRYSFDIKKSNEKDTLMVKFISKQFKVVNNNIEI